MRMRLGILLGGVPATASTIWLIFCAVSAGEREGLASFGGGGELVGGSAAEGAGGEDVASVVGTWSREGSWSREQSHLLSVPAIDRCH